MNEFNSAIRVSGRAVTYFGSQSISNDASAMFELIKNSRDADAKNVSITFEHLGDENARIVVEDDGTGMPHEGIMDKWLVAGTDTKIRNPRSAGGKDVLGEKGIGRFACEKLSKKTILESYPQDEKDVIWMSFDWRRYTEPGATFEGVKHPGRIMEKSDASKHGLKLILENLNSDWTEKAVHKVAEELGTFILPEELKGPGDIDIVINAEQYGIKDTHVVGAVTRKAPMKMKARFADGELSVKILDVNNNNGDWIESDIDESFDDMKCGPFEFRLYFYPRDTAKKSGGRYESYYTDSTEITEFLSKHSGVYLYKGAAWMKPLGGKHDWLNLEARRVQRGTSIGLSQVYGVIRITQSKNPDIRSTSHRETVQHNKAFDDLKTMVMKSIKRLEKYKESQKKEREGGPIPSTLAKNNINTINNTLNTLRNTIPETDFKQLKHDITVTKNYIKEQEQDKETDIRQFGELRHHEDTVASLGLLTSYLAHEITTPLRNNIEVITKMRDMVKSTDLEKGDRVNMAQEDWRPISILEANTNHILHFTSFVRELSRHIAASVSMDGGSIQFEMADAWKTIAEGMEDFTKDLNIETSMSVDEGMRISFSRIDLEAILTNLFLNSINALKDKEGTRRIHFEARYTNELTIKFSDDGKGIGQEHLGRIFDPFYIVTDDPDDTAHGHGLGLAIVKKIVVDRHEGKVNAVSTSSEFHGAGTTIILSFPARKVPRVAVK